MTTRRRGRMPWWTAYCFCFLCVKKKENKRYEWEGQLAKLLVVARGWTSSEERSRKCVGGYRYDKRADNRSPSTIFLPVSQHHYPRLCWHAIADCSQLHCFPPINILSLINTMALRAACRRLPSARPTTLFAQPRHFSSTTTVSSPSQDGKSV